MWATEDAAGVLLVEEPRWVHNVLDCINSFRERLYTACELAHSFLSDAQSKMKETYNSFRQENVF